MIIRTSIVAILLAPVGACIIADQFVARPGLGWHSVPWNATGEIVRIATSSSGWSKNTQVGAIALSVVGAILLCAYIAAGLASFWKRSLYGAIITMTAGVILVWAWGLFVLIPLSVIPQT